MLITRPNHDVTTNYLYFWSKPILEQAKKSKVSLTDLVGIRANYSEFTSIVKKTHPSLIVFNGHGSESVVAGYDNEYLVEAGRNDKILAGSVIYARSCKSAKVLGPKSIISGCKAYIGYDDDFVFFIEDRMINRPLEDKTAKLFIQPSNQVVISLLKGQSAGDSNRRSKEGFKRIIQKMATSASTKEKAELVPYMVWNYTHQVCLGDGYV